jgi:hypothetical protein
MHGFFSWFLKDVPRLSNFKFHNFLPPDFKHVNPQHLQLLGYGPRFSPRPNEFSFAQIQASFNSFVRRFCIHDYFNRICRTPLDSDDFDKRFHTPSDWLPPKNSFEAVETVRFMENHFRHMFLPTWNRFKRDSTYSALRELNSNPFIKIVLADKNLGLCVFTIEDYHSMVSVHLYDVDHYKFIDFCHGPDWQDTLRLLLEQHNDLLVVFKDVYPDKTAELKFLCGSEHDLPKFHVIPKIHKGKRLPLSSRPIVGAVNWITTRWAIYLCSVLEKFHCPYVLHNSIALVSTLEHHPVEENDFLITADVSSLYTMMSLSRLYERLAAKGVDRFEIVILQFICDNNYFQYGSEVFRQLDGIAMGFNAAVHCANIYLDDFDERFASHFLFYRRYIDDIFAIYRGAEQSLRSLFSVMNTFIPGIQLNFEISLSRVNFLDLSIFKKEGRICFQTFQKTHNLYQYLPPTSLHSPHCISGFIKGEITRFIRCNTNILDRKFFCLRFRERLLARGYSKVYLDRIFSQVSLHSRSLATTPSLSSTKLIPLIVPFSNSRTVQSLKRLIFILNRLPFYSDKNVRFILAFKRNPNVLSLCSRSNISRTQETYLQHIRVYYPERDPSPERV